MGATIGEAAMVASRTKTFLGSRCRRIVKRRATKRALVAVGNSILTVAYCLLSDPHARFDDLGVDFHDLLHPTPNPSTDSANSNTSPVRQ
jgi:transposase